MFIGRTWGPLPIPRGGGGPESQQEQDLCQLSIPQALMFYSSFGLVLSQARLVFLVAGTGLLRPSLSPRWLLQA